MTARRCRPGTSSCNNSNRLLIISDEVRHRPVSLLRGSAKLSTTPMATGSSTATRTVGIVVLTRLAASVAAVPTATRTTMPEPTTSLMMPGNSSVRSSAQRSRTAILLPSIQPSAVRPPRNALRRLWLSCGVPAWMRPMRGIVVSAKLGLQATAVAARESKSRRLTSTPPMTRLALCPSYRAATLSKCVFFLPQDSVLGTVPKFSFPEAPIGNPSGRPSSSGSRPRWVVLPDACFTPIAERSGLLAKV